ncbi:MAG: dipeptide epimerase [Calditrichaceae bacterium]
MENGKSSASGFNHSILPLFHYSIKNILNLTQEIIDMITSKIIRLHLSHAWTISRNSSDYKDNVFVKLEKDGIAGLGEAAPNIRYGESAELTMEKIEQAKHIFETYEWKDYGSIKETLDKKIVDQSCAKAALDIALLDWNSKIQNKPLYQFLGLKYTRPLTTSYSIGIDSPEIIEQKIREARDFPVLKIKLGTPDDETIMRTIRNLTDKPLRIDANEGWKNKEEALEKIKWLEDQNVQFIEQPLPAGMIQETAWLRKKCSLPIIADEAVMTSRDIPQITKAYDGINIKLMKSGGIQEALKMIRLARQHNLKIMLGCMIESSLAISAAAHLSPLADWLDLDGNLLIDNDPFTGDTPKKGQIILNNKYGLGVIGNIWY